MQIIDYIVLIVFLLFLLAMGFFLSKRAGKSTDEFILAGRKLPWWLAGTSIAATGLNASTMLQDSRKIRQDGIAGMWFTWGNVVGAIVSSIWFIRLWRRASFVTQMEFYHARYVGWRATFARVYDSVIYGVIVAAIWAAVGIVGMKKIASVLLDLPATVTVLGLSMPTDTIVVVVLLLITMIYSAASGVYGVVWTDLIEFLIAMICSYMLLFIVFKEVGWSTGLREKIEGMGPEGAEILQILPEFGIVLFYYLLIGPLLSQGGYNPHIQRYLGVKDEREVVFTQIYNAVINFIFKSWPFYIIGLAGMFVISDAFLLENFGGIETPGGEIIADYEKVFPALAERYLPPGILGLMTAGFLAAFMSSFDTNVHNSTSIVTNDIYRAYLAKDKSQKHYVKASRIFLCLETLLAACIGLLVDDILMLTFAAFSVMKAVGIVKLLRFVWWRVNGLSEVVAQVVALITTAVFLSPIGKEIVLSLMQFTGQEGNDAFFVYRIILMISGSSVASIIVILVSKPEPMEHLCKFYNLVRPFGFWKPVREACGDEVGNPDPLGLMILLTIAGLSIVYGMLFGVLGLFLAYFVLSAIALFVAFLGFIGLFWGLNRLYPKQEASA